MGAPPDFTAASTDFKERNFCFTMFDKPDCKGKKVSIKGDSKERLGLKKPFALMSARVDKQCPGEEKSGSAPSISAPLL